MNILYGPAAQKALNERKISQNYIEQSKKFIEQHKKNFPDYYLYVGKSFNHNIYFDKYVWWRPLNFDLHYDMRDGRIYCLLDDLDEAKLIAEKLACDIFVYGA